MEQEKITFLFNIAKEIKKSFESPVILLTSEDYANGIYRTLLEMRTALMDHATPIQISQIINNFHLDWVHAVKDVVDFRKRIKQTPKDVILNAIDYTIRCVSNRYDHFDNLIQRLRATLSAEDSLIMQTDLEVMNEMKYSVMAVLEDKKHCFKIQVDHYEYTVKLNYEVDELLNWLDRIYDSLAMLFCKVTHLPHLHGNLTKTLMNTIDNVAGTLEPTPEILENTESSKVLTTMVRFSASHELEVTKVSERIRVLEYRINRLKEKKSSAVLALQHKVIYLEERLQSLQNLELSLNALKTEKSRELGEQEVLDSTELHIFNHNLPQVDRCRLVERLIKVWDNALLGDETGKSIIAILSADDKDEVYTDDVGQFTVDRYGRKIYSINDRNYQLNERNVLVEVNDDDTHVYFYDDCGRYYLDEARHRIYKDHESASEFELFPTGQLVKLREMRDGIEYMYDHRGRYRIEDGRRIYTDLDTYEKYEMDGFNNLVRVHSDKHYVSVCPPETMVVKECQYLKNTVGNALRTCLANVVLHQPADPIAFLADHLEKYRRNMIEREKRLEEEREMNAEREYYEPASITLKSYQSEVEGFSKSRDYNLESYHSMMPEE